MTRPRIHMLEKRLCIRCNAEFTTTENSKRKYCSRSCNVSVRNTQMTLPRETRSCEWCKEKTFEVSINSRRRFCSLSCVTKYRNQTCGNPFQLEHVRKQSSLRAIERFTKDNPMWQPEVAKKISVLLTKRNLENWQDPEYRSKMLIHNKEISVVEEDWINIPDCYGVPHWRRVLRRNGKFVSPPVGKTKQPKSESIGINYWGVPY